MGSQDARRFGGNTHDLREFVGMMRPLARDLLTATMPGRSCAIHLCQTTAQKVRDGYVGIKDFRGHVIRLISSTSGNGPFLSLRDARKETRSSRGTRPRAVPG